MQTLILTYNPPGAAQPAIDFRYGARAVKLAAGETKTVVRDPNALPLPPGVTAEVQGAKPPRPSRVMAAKRGEKFVPLATPARKVAFDSKTTKAGKAEKD